jgi:hypothetical protein
MLKEAPGTVRVFNLLTLVSGAYAEESLDRSPSPVKFGMDAEHEIKVCFS